MNIREYAVALGTEEIMLDLQGVGNLDNTQQEAVTKLLTAFTGVLKNENHETQKEKLTVAMELLSDERLKTGRKTDNVILKHATNSLLLLLELTKDSKEETKKWFEIFVESQTPKQIVEQENKKQNDGKDTSLIQKKMVEIPLGKRLEALDWLDENVSCDPLWSGYQKQSLLKELQEIGIVDNTKDEGVIANTKVVRAKVNKANILIRKRLTEVINHYREILSLDKIYAEKVEFGEDEIKHYDNLLENGKFGQLSGYGDLSFTYLADTILREVIDKDDSILTKAESYTVDVFFTKFYKKKLENSAMETLVLDYRYLLQIKPKQEE